MNIGVIVGRFQVPDLHEGHVELIEKALEENDVVLVFIGENLAGIEKDNPLTYEQREFMVRERFRSVIIDSIKDVPGNDEVWSSILDGKIYRYVSFRDEVYLYGGRDSFLDHYTGIFQKKCYVPEVSEVSGTAIRELHSKFEVFDRLFRIGSIFASARRFYNPVPCVDIAAIHGIWGHSTLLLGRKPNATMWQLPGGFVDPFEDYETAAKREFKEECGVDDIVSIKPLRSFRVKDSRWDKHSGIVTMMYEIVYKGLPVAGDDLAEVKAVPISDIDLKHIYPHHREMVSLILKRYKHII